MRILLAASGLFLLLANSAFVVADQFDNTVTRLKDMAAQCENNLADAGNIAVECVTQCENSVRLMEGRITSSGLSYEKLKPLIDKRAVQPCEIRFSKAGGVVPGNKLTARVSVPDVEGIYLGTGRGTLRVSVDGRAEDWDNICLGQARVENQAEFIRTIKRTDKVHLSGIAYDPADVSETNRVSPCTAKSLVILGGG